MMTKPKSNSLRVPAENDSRLSGLFREWRSRSQSGRGLRLAMEFNEEVDGAAQASDAVADSEMVQVLVVCDRNADMKLFGIRSSLADWARTFFNVRDVGRRSGLAIRLAIHQHFQGGALPLEKGYAARPGGGAIQESKLPTLPGVRDSRNGRRLHAPAKITFHFGRDDSPGALRGTAAPAVLQPYP